MYYFVTLVLLTNSFICFRSQTDTMKDAFFKSRFSVALLNVFFRFRLQKNEDANAPNIMNKLLHKMNFWLMEMVYTDLFKESHSIFELCKNTMW